MRELVPMRKTPPLFAAEPCAAEPETATAASTSATGHHFLISSSSAEGGFVERERPRIGIERITDTQREGSHVLPVAERQLVQERDAERLEVLLEDVLERPRAGPVGRLALVAPVAVLHLAEDDADRLLQLARGRELGQEPVHVVRRRLHVLEEEDRAGQADLPRGSHR